MFTNEVLSNEEYWAREDASTNLTNFNWDQTGADFDAVATNPLDILIAEEEERLAR